MITQYNNNNNYKESSLTQYQSSELKDLFEPLIELIQEEDHDTVHWLEGGEVRSYDRVGTVQTWKLGRCAGRQMFDVDEADLYKNLVNELALFTIVKDFAQFVENCWELMPIWEAGELLLHDEGLIELFNTKEDFKRISILDRAIEACKMLNKPIITRLDIKYSREALRLERAI